MTERNLGGGCYKLDGRLHRVTVALLFEARAQVLVKALEASEMVWMNADLMCFDYCRGTGRGGYRIIRLLQIDNKSPSR